MEDRPEGPVTDDPQDVVAATPCLSPLGHVAADERPGEVCKLNEGRQYLERCDLIDGFLGVTPEEPDEQAVVSNGRVSDRVDAEAL